MRLVSMSITGGHRRITHEGLKVGPVTLLTGANGRGKSTRLGIPELVLTPTVQGAYPVLGATDYDWSAALRFDDATMVARFVSKGKPGVAINGIPVGVRDASKRLPEAVGASATLSIGAFLSLPARERMTWLQEHVLHGAGWSVDEARQRLDAVATDYPAVAEDLRAATGVDGREALRDAWKRVDEASKQGGKDVTRLGGAISTAEAAEKARQLPEGDVAGWRVKLDELNTEIGRVREARGRADQAAKEAKRQDAERASLTAELDALNNTDHDALDQRAQAAVDEARTKATAAATAAQEARQRHEAAAATADQKQRELVEAQASAKLAPRFTAWMERLRALGAEDVIEEMQALVDADTAGEQALADAAGRQRDTAKRALDAAVSAQATADKAVTTATTQLEALRVARNGHGTRAAELARRIEEISTRLAELEGEAGNLDTHDQELRGLAVRRDDALKAIDLLTDATGARAALLIHREDLRTAEARRSQGRAARDAVEGLLADLMTEAVGPFVDVASRITEAVTGLPLRVDLRGGFSWQLGTDADAHGEGSRSEHAVALIALRVAIVSGRPGWRSVVLDDLENLDADRRWRLLQVMVDEAARGTFDNFLAAGVIESGTSYPDGVTVHEL